ncbi:MAG TPA: bifunctional GNAT family N-acetyltransferase/(deoxy)nucleoside triphosphate pyrophosphohydrolase [Acidocella sp.]|nr:bifunctional GNAT family N-acetyltransferase/(deoxy)nucleoside triphosphate pyrophosphohydrolase [Acidocella sp.]
MDDLFDSLITTALTPEGAAAGPVLRTSRLLLRPLAADDAPVFHRLINDWEICRKLPDAPFPYPASLAGDWIAAAGVDRAAGKAEQFAVVDAATGTLIGCAGLRLSKDKKSADLGYWLGRAYWRQGFGLETALRLTSWAFAALSVLKITATVAADNEGSVAVLSRVGFAPAGKGNQEFQCRPGIKLPVQHFVLTRESQATAAPATPSVLLVVACALIDAEGRILLARRPEGKKLAGLWEFPGGKLNPGETPEAALVRELHEELGIEVAQKHLAPFVFASHAYDTFHLLMPLFLCRKWTVKPKPREGQALAWVAPDRLVEYPMPPADRPLIPMLRDFL